MHATTPRGRVGDRPVETGKTLRYMGLALSQAKLRRYYPARVKNTSPASRGTRGGVGRPSPPGCARQLGLVHGLVGPGTSSPRLSSSGLYWAQPMLMPDGMIRRHPSMARRETASGSAPPPRRPRRDGCPAAAPETPRRRCAPPCPGCATAPLDALGHGGGHPVPTTGGQAGR